MDNSNQKRIEVRLQRQLNRLVLPILLETLLTFLLGGVDTFMLSQHSDDAVAAAMLVPLCFVRNILAQSYGIALSK